MASKVYETAIGLVDEKYRREFRRFTETGEASKEFLDYLDNNGPAQKAVDLVFESQAKAFEAFVRQFREDAGLEGKVTKQ